MSSTSFSRQLEIGASPDAVWQALTQASGPRRWLNGALVASSWEPGADVEIDVELEGLVRHDRGTVEAADRPQLLRYSLWSSISRRSDRPDHRSIVTFRLAPTEAGGTLLTLHQDQLGHAAALPHAAYFWGVALAVLRDELEGRPPGALAGLQPTTPS